MVIEGNETAIRNSHAMGVGAEIPQHLIGSAEGRFAVHHPPQAVELMDQAPEEPRLHQSFEHALKDQFSGGVGLLESLQKFAAEDLAENAFREKEARAARMLPVRVIWRQTSGGDHTVNVRMMLELLIPGVEDAEESNLGAEVFWICGNFYKRLRTAAEQQAVHQVFVPQGQER